MHRTGLRKEKGEDRGKTGRRPSVNTCKDWDWRGKMLSTRQKTWMVGGNALLDVQLCTRWTKVRYAYGKGTGIGGQMEEESIIIVKFLFIQHTRWHDRIMLTKLQVHATGYLLGASLVADEQRWDRREWFKVDRLSSLNFAVLGQVPLLTHSLFYLIKQMMDSSLTLQKSHVPQSSVRLQALQLPHIRADFFRFNESFSNWKKV